jgi:predicted phage-related endonuclease
LEDDVLELYRLETQSLIARVGTLQHPTLEYVCASPDALALPMGGDPRPLEVKTCAFRRDEWGEPGTDQVPSMYLIQGIWQARLLRDVGMDVDDYIDIPVLFWGSEFQIYRVKYDAELADHLLEVAKEFHVDYVKPRRPPPVDDSPAYEQYVRHVYPRNVAPMRKASPREIELVRQYAEAQQREKLVEKEAQRHKSELMAAIGEAGGLDAGDFRVTWQADKNGKRSLRVQPKKGGSSREGEEVAA